MGSGSAHVDVQFDGVDESFHEKIHILSADSRIK